MLKYLNKKTSNFYINKNFNIFKKIEFVRFYLQIFKKY